MRRFLAAAACAASWALLLFAGLSLWAAADYCRSVPVLYSFFGAEALEEKIARAQIWVAVQGVGFLGTAILCFAVTRLTVKGRKNRREKR